MNLTAVEDAWLVYARRVIDCSSAHRAACIAAGGAPIATKIDADLRWPGMLGARYESAKYRILCIGQIHLETEWVEVRENIGSLQPLMRAWRNRTIGDADFLSEYRSRYARYLLQWGPWKKAFGPALRPLGIGAEDVAYVNFARCWQAADSRVYEAMHSCSGPFPTSEVYEIVKPDAAIVLSGKSVFAAYKELMAGVPADRWRHFPGRRSFAMRPEDIEYMRSWLTARLGLPAAD